MEGVKEAKKMMSQVLKEVYAEDKRRRAQAASHVKGKIRKKISDQYYDGYHSAPGEPPGTITGNLIAGLAVDNMKTVSLVGFKAPAYHAHLMEFGALNRVDKQGKPNPMKPRPIIGPTFAEEAGAVQRIIAGTWVK
jgi:hypothetical protein